MNMSKVYLHLNSHHFKTKGNNCHMFPQSHSYLQTRKNKSHLHQFSLVELLVIFSILLIVMSLLQPSLGKMIQHASRIVCMNQMHQIHSTSMVYAEDNESYLPTQVRPGGRGAHTIWVTEVTYQGLLNYGLNHDHFTAPNFKDELSLKLNPGIKSRVSGYSWLMGHSSIMSTFERSSLPKSDKWVSALKTTDLPSSLVVADLNEIGRNSWVAVGHPSWGDGINFSRTKGETVEPLTFGSEGGHVATLGGAVTWKAITEMKQYTTYPTASKNPAYSGWW
jgi:competence protein ComGC